MEPRRRSAPRGDKTGSCHKRPDARRGRGRGAARAAPVDGVELAGPYSPDGALILLRDQDRSSWDRALIEEGHAIVRACLRRNQPGPYQIQAAINAVHADADSIEATDWSQVLALYDQLLAMTPTPVVAMNRAIALGEVRVPQPLSTSSTASSSASTTCSTRPARTCCAGSDATTRRASPTPAPRPWLPATPNGPSSWPASKRPRQPGDGRLGTAEVGDWLVNGTHPLLRKVSATTTSLLSRSRGAVQKTMDLEVESTERPQEPPGVDAGRAVLRRAFADRPRISVRVDPAA